MAPRGSRPGREAKPVATKARASNRAGVTKRKGRVDGDGDMDMDGSAARRLKTGGADAASKSRTTTRAANRTRPTKIAQTVAKHLGNGTGGDLASRVKTAVKGASLVYLRVHGMKQSKAAANPDGGLKDLLSFIERKATSLLDGRRTRQVIIKKVCFTERLGPTHRQPSKHLSLTSTVTRCRRLRLHRRQRSRCR